MQIRFQHTIYVYLIPLSASADTDHFEPRTFRGLPQKFHIAVHVVASTLRVAMGVYITMRLHITQTYLNCPWWRGVFRYLFEYLCGVVLSLPNNRRGGVIHENVIFMVNTSQPGKDNNKQLPRCVAALLLPLPLITTSNAYRANPFYSAPSLMGFGSLFFRRHKHELCSRAFYWPKAFECTHLAGRGEFEDSNMHTIWLS